MQIEIGQVGATGLKWPNAVNGRLLTADDLSTSQAAVHTRDRWLGMTSGSGIASGFEVLGSAGATKLSVSPGTGVCPGGTAVHLDAPVTLDLVVVTTAAAVEGDRFAECRPPTTSAQAPVAGAYVLVVRPRTSFDGSIPTLGPVHATLPTPCASRWEVEELTFAVVRLDGFSGTTTAANRRNRLAHWCFGSDVVDDVAFAGFDGSISHRGLDGAQLGPCDLPLAVVDWNGGAITFVDQWSVRRRPVRPAGTVLLADVVDDRRTADGEARFLQFQQQLGAQLATSAGASISALDVFPQLPPAGLVPIDPLTTAELLAAMSKGKVEAEPAADSVHRVVGHEMTRFMKARFVDDDVETELGAFSTAMRKLQQQIDVLRADLDDLQAATGGAGGPGSSAAERQAGRKLAMELARLLADTPGSGVDPSAFFAGVDLRLGVIGHESVDFTIRRSWYDEAIDIGVGESLTVLFVTSRARDRVAPYVLFVKRISGISWIRREVAGLSA